MDPNVVRTRTVTVRNIAPLVPDLPARTVDEGARTGLSDT